MAQPDVSFPKIAEANWWKVRDLFKRKVPTIVTPNTLASGLSMTEASARANIYGPFKKIGLLGDDGKPTDLAYDWRDDEKYPTVCQHILEATYLSELRDFYHSLDQDPSGLISWFMKYCRCGEPAAKMYATFYRLLLRADPTNQDQTLSKQPSSPAKPSKARATTTNSKPRSSEIQVVQEAPATPAMPREETQSRPVQLSPVPQLHINIQLHISPETTAEQIDKIFESMSRHLKNLVEVRT